MIRAIIIEDEPFFIDLINKIINENLIKTIEIIDSTDNAEDAFLLIKKHKPDLLFLDVELNGMSGIDLLQKFDNSNFYTIITTSHDKYALTAIKHEAIDYLTKPYNKIDFIIAIEKVQKRMGLVNSNELVLKQKNDKIIISSSDGIQFIEIDNIIRCESDSNYTTYYIKNSKPIIVSRTLKDVESTLLKFNFCRVHRTHLINLDYVVKYQKGDGGNITLADGSIIAVSRSQKDELMRRLYLSN